MPSLHASTPTINGWDLSHQLEHMSVYMTKVARCIGYLVTFLSSSTFMIITFGAPYLHYRLYAYDGGNSTEKWLEAIKLLDASWDHYCHLPLQILPTLFPMASSSGLSLCSTATFVATMTLTVGVISVATSSIYKLNAKALHNEHAIDEWLEASQPTWRQVPNKSFWVFMALPTLVFFLSVGLFISTVMLTVWERSLADTTPSLIIQGCSPTKLQAFKVVSLVMLVPIVAHFVFILTKTRSITTLRTADVSSIV